MTATRHPAVRKGAASSAPTSTRVPVSGSGGGTSEPATDTVHRSTRNERQTEPGSRSILSRLPAVSEPDDPLEKEAEAAADRIVANQPVGRITSTAGGSLEPQPGRMEDEEVPAAPAPPVQRLIQRMAEAPGRTTNVSSLVRSPGTGSPIPAPVRSRIEPNLGVGLGGVRVHDDGRAAEAASAINARAFTFGSDIFLNDGESPNDLAVMAHEATHVAQQGALDGLTRMPTAGDEEEIQRIPGWLADKIAGYARYVPGYTLFTVLIEYNPINGRNVPRTPQNFVQGILELVPFGPWIYDKLVELDVIRPALAFIERQLTTFNISLTRVERLIGEAWDRMDFIRWDPFDYNLGVLKDVFLPLWEDVKGFAGSIVSAVVDLIRSAAADFADGLLGDNRAWALIKKVIGYDPIRGEEVEATTVEILEDFLLLIGRQTELEQMREKGTLQETADWIDTQVASFLDLLAAFGALISAAWDAIQPSNLPNLFDSLRGLATRLGDLLVRVWDFASTVALKVLELVKDALLGMLSDFVHYVPGFHLVTVLIGRNPFTGEPVPRTAENLIKGFISLLPGGILVYEKLAETGVVAQAGAAIDAAVNDLGISWSMISGLFRGIWDGLGIGDLVDPIGAFTRIRDQFGEPISRLFRFIGVVVKEMIGLILAVMNFPTELIGRILTNAMEAIDSILADPIGFILNMLRAVKSGFLRFFDNIFDHLLNGLIDWLFRGLRSAGIEPPSELTIESALDLALQILDISVERLWEKLADRFGQERVDQLRAGIDRLVGVWEFVRDVQSRGLAAIWEYVESQISNLWDVIIEQARNWIMTEIVSKVTEKLLTMLDPTGIMAVVNGFIAFFNAVQSVIEYIRDILEIIDRYVATMAAIARGDIEPGAAKLEEGLAAAIPVAIGFLANQVGLGNVGAKIAEIVGGLRDTIDQALDWLVDQAERALASVLEAVGLGGEEQEDEIPHVDGDWLVERPEGGHTIRIDHELRVFRFSEPSELEGVDAAAELQQTLEAMFPLVPPNFTALDSLGRAIGPNGRVGGVKPPNSRTASPPPVSALGGSTAYGPDDVRGHLIGDRFYGPAVAGNLVPMHESLNGSEFKVYENSVASAHNALSDAGKPVLLTMSVVPNYPSSGNVLRPASITATSQTITLGTTGSGLTVVRSSPIAGTFTNPEGTHLPVSILTADPVELGARLRPRDGSRTRELIEWIVRVRRPGMDNAGFFLALAEAMGDRYVLAERQLIPRLHLFTL